MKSRLDHSPTISNSRALPLFAAAEAERVRRLPIAARRLARRLNVPSETAVTIAELAGFHMEAR